LSGGTNVYPTAGLNAPEPVVLMIVTSPLGSTVVSEFFTVIVQVDASLTNTGEVQEVSVVVVMRVTATVAAVEEDGGVRLS